MDLLKRDYHIALFDIYMELLTDKQKEYFIAYYYDDLSLAEIASEKNVSRNAIFDQIKKAISLLEFYEEKLSLYRKRSEIEEVLEDSPQFKEKILSILKE